MAEQKDQAAIKEAIKRRKKVVYTPVVPKMQLGFVHNNVDCIGCRACEIACKQEHGLGVGPRLVRIIERSPDFIPVYCRHCARPPCRDACPAGAISRDERGIVWINADLCIGCLRCTDICPDCAITVWEENEDHG